MVEELLRSWTLRDRFAAKLRVIENAHPSAEQQGKSECCRSGVCCWRMPCQLGKGDPQKIAAHLGTTPEALFRESLVVNRTGGEGELHLMPRRKQQQGGQMLGWEETYDIETPCVFLGADNACQIHEVKPVGGKEYKCWDESTHEQNPDCIWKQEELIALGWDGEERE